MKRVLPRFSRFGIPLLFALLGGLSGLRLFGLFFGAAVGILLQELLFRYLAYRYVRSTAGGREAGGFGLDPRPRKLIPILLLLRAGIREEEGGEILFSMKEAYLQRKAASLWVLNRREAYLVESCFSLPYGRIRPGILLNGIAGNPLGLRDRADVVRLLRDLLGGGVLLPAPGGLVAALCARMDLSLADLYPGGDGLTGAYRILGIRSDTELSEVKRIYRRLASQFHPDGMAALSEGQRRQSEEAFLRLKGAYELVLASRGAEERR